MSYTVKEAADKLNVSKPTIRKYLNKLSADDVVDNHIDDEKGTLIISQRCFEALQMKIEKKLENESETIENNRKESETLIENDWKTSETIENNRKYLETIEKQSEMFQKQLEIMENQLIEKDKQIAALTNTIQTLTDTLSVTQQSLQTEQALHAGTIKKQLTDTSGSENESEKKQSIFKKIFGKKK